VRQNRRDLTLVAPISDMLFDVLIGAGCARAVVAAWIGNVSVGSGYNFRRAVEEGVPNALEVTDHSNLTIALALQAAAMGVPYLPTRSTLGTDLLGRNAHLKEISCPFTGQKRSCPLKRSRRTSPSCQCSSATPKATPTFGETSA
jgi:glutaconate CoA-transferase subunit A